MRRAALYLQREREPTGDSEKHCQVVRLSVRLTDSLTTWQCRSRRKHRFDGTSQVCFESLKSLPTRVSSTPQAFSHGHPQNQAHSQRSCSTVGPFLLFRLLSPALAVSLLLPGLRRAIREPRRHSRAAHRRSVAARSPARCGGNCRPASRRRRPSRSPGQSHSRCR